MEIEYATVVASVEPKKNQRKRYRRGPCRKVLTTEENKPHLGVDSHALECGHVVIMDHRPEHTPTVHCVRCFAGEAADPPPTEPEFAEVEPEPLELDFAPATIQPQVLVPYESVRALILSPDVPHAAKPWAWDLLIALDKLK